MNLLENKTIGHLKAARFVIFFLFLSDPGIEDFACLLYYVQLFFTPTCLHTLSAFLNEPHREKTGFLPRRKQRRRSASR